MTLAEVCVRRPVFTTMLILFLVVLGVFSFLDLGVDLFPKADPPIVSVRVRLPGASPDEMTSQVILPVEEQLSSVSGLDELEIMVMDGSARITCRFVLDRKMEDAAQDVREKMALAMGKMPPNVEPPVITKVLTQIRGLLGSPLNLTARAFDIESNNGSASSSGMSLCSHPQDVPPE